jgi:hypothetical protein
VLHTRVRTKLKKLVPSHQTIRDYIVRYLIVKPCLIAYNYTHGFADEVLLAIHFVAEIGFQANDAVTLLKMVERGS